MTNTSLRRPGFLAHTLIPQLGVLVFFLFDRFEVWVKLFASLGGGFFGVAGFFFDIVTHGAGWAMLSLSVLATSIVLHQLDAGPFYARLVENGFDKASAEEVMAAHARENAFNSRLRHWVLAWLGLCALVAVGSFIGGLIFESAYSPHASFKESPIELSITTLLALVFAGLSSKVCQLMAEERELTLEWMLQEVLDLRDWTPEELLLWDQADAAGRLSHPQVQAAFAAQRQQLLDDAEFAEDYAQLQASR